MNVKEFKPKIHLIKKKFKVLIYDIWKWTLITLRVNFAEDHKKYSYNKNIFMGKKIRR
jgi:hypothetical protein